MCSKLNCKETIVWAGNRPNNRVSNLLEEVNVKEIIDILQAGKDLNWDTYAKLAFAVPSSTPGLLDEDVFKRQVLEKLFVIPQERDMPVRATVVRRFWYESHVLFVSNMRQELDCSDTTPQSHAARRARLDEEYADNSAGSSANVLFVIEPSPALK